MLLLSIGLVLISTLPWVAGVFDGIDRAAIWHRRVAITGMVLLVPHIVLSANPHASSLGPLLGVIGAPAAAFYVGDVPALCGEEVPGSGALPGSGTAAVVDLEGPVP